MDKPVDQSLIYKQLRGILRAQAVEIDPTLDEVQFTVTVVRLDQGPASVARWGACAHAGSP